MVDSTRARIAFSGWLLLIEGLILAAAVYAFWFPSAYPGDPMQPVDRAEWTWLLALLLPVMAARLLLCGRLWTPTPLHGWFLLFLALGVLNTRYAPYEYRGVFLLARPLLGMALVVFLIELARVTGSMRRPLAVVTGIGLLVGVMALGATQWVSKSDDLRFIIDHLPRIDYYAIAGGFNPNEIAGAMAWLAPLTAGAGLYALADAGATGGTGRFLGIGLGSAALGAFAMLSLALLLGQSRSAIGGVFVGLAGLALLAIRSWRWRYAALAGLALAAAFQVNLVLNLVPISGGTAGSGPADAGLSRRDEQTIGQRFDIWASAFAIVRDHPLTGAGMSSFGYGSVRRDYPVRGFDVPYNQTTGDPPADFRPRRVPHAHNEFIQIASDMGLPGLAAFTGWHVAVVWMLWLCWRGGDKRARLVAAAAGMGLAAHGIYGMSDAIPLWDRFAFVGWMLVGLAAGQYALVRKAAWSATEQADEEMNAQ